MTASQSTKFDLRLSCTIGTCIWYEIEFSALSRQCTDRRFDSREHLQREVIAWAQARNAAATSVCWRFTTPGARIKLASLYPRFGA
jgi:hypothetical protein